MTQESARSCQFGLAMVAAFYLLAPTALADRITVFSNTTDWLESTTIDASPLNETWLGVGTLPAVGTFSLTPVADSSDYDLVAGSTLIHSGSGVRYLRTAFNVPEFSAISADFQSSFDNSAQIFVNGNEFALEGSIASENFDNEIHHRIFVDHDGGVTNGYRGGAPSTPSRIPSYRQTGSTAARMRSSWPFGTTLHTILGVFLLG